jgi:D-lactate dehydrogenase (cytochrome)
VLYDINDAGQRERADALARNVSMRAIAMGGTCTGEHGIGWHKLEALVHEHGEAVDLMRAVKRALDPHNIMNPGKTVPL